MHTASFDAGNGPALPAEALAGLTPARRREQWRPLLREPPGGARIVVAEVGDVVVGLASSGPARDSDVAGEPAGELYALYVDPAAWRQGHGGALHDAALSHLARTGFSTAILWVLERNEGARRFYETRGWSPDGARRDFKGADSLRLRRSV